MIAGTNTVLDEALAFNEGDHFDGIEEIEVLDDGVPPTDNVASAIMQFRRTWEDAEVIAQLSSADAQITINDANLWTFTIAAQAITKLLRGDYVWAFRTTDVNGVKKTRLMGTIKVAVKAVID